MLLKKIEVKSKPAAQQAGSKTKFSFVLPTALSKPPDSLIGYSTLIYGTAGIGKTSLVREYGKVLFLTFEPASESISVFRTPMLVNDAGSTGWEKLRTVISALEQDKQDFVAVCFDTVSPAYDRCLEYVCKRENIEHPGLVQDFGASWKKVSAEFQDANARLRALGLPVIALAHEKLEIIETRAGKQYSLVKPAITGALEAYYRSSAAIVGYYYALSGERWMQVVQDDFVTAKCPEGRFLTPAGERVQRIRMGNDGSRAAFKSMQAAFNNKQEEQYTDAGIVAFVAEQSRSGKFGKAKKQERSA